LMTFPAIRPAWAITRSAWLAHRKNFLVLLSAPLVCGWLLHASSSTFLKSESAAALAILLVGFSLFLTFVFCNFTESDKRGRSDGFPVRMFTLPVSTRTLVLVPVGFSVLAVGIVYTAWATLALPALGWKPPLSWPLLYLAAGMTWYHAIVWSLARFRIARVLVLGLGGAFLSTAWLVVSPALQRDEFSLLPESFRHLLCGALFVISLAALVVACVTVENQRRGGMRISSREKNGVRGKYNSEFFRPRTLLERMADVLPRSQRRFGSPAQAQFWFEWRRHGSLLPKAVGGVLLLIVAPAPFQAPISVGRAEIVLSWMLALPVLLAVMLGKGFGKADLWANAPGLPLFQATRPLSNTDWIAAKMKAAFWAVASSWLIVLATAALWLWLWCDHSAMLAEWHKAANENWRFELQGTNYETRFPGLISIGSVLMFLAVLIFFTWRFLIGSLYVGLSGKAWLLNLAACGVLLSIFVPPLCAAADVPDRLKGLLYPPWWFQWSLAGLLAAKFAAALLFAGYARQKGFVATRGILKYLIISIVTAVVLVVLVRHLIPYQLVLLTGWNKRIFALLTLFFVPVLRMSIAPIVLARNRRN
jgi:hypothetical protein